jgi:hypothetical protein
MSFIKNSDLQLQVYLAGPLSSPSVVGINQHSLSSSLCADCAYLYIYYERDGVNFRGVLLPLANRDSSVCRPGSRVEGLDHPLVHRAGKLTSKAPRCTFWVFVKSTFVTGKTWESTRRQRRR